MRRRLAIYGASDDALDLVAELERNPAIEIVCVCDADPDAVRERLRARRPAAAASIAGRLAHTARLRAEAARLDAVIDGGVRPPFASRFPDLARGGLQVVDAHTARLLWAFSGPDRRDALLRSLRELIHSYDFSVAAPALRQRLVEIAVGASPAEGGSLMLLDPGGRELVMAGAVGVEPELWPKIRVPLGAGLAGYAAGKARALRVRGRADPRRFRIVRERLDVAAALCVPLLHEGRLVGVLNLHHRTRPGAFADADLGFAGRLAEIYAALLVRAAHHTALAEASRSGELLRAVRERMAGARPLTARVASVCELLAERAGRGVASVHGIDAGRRALRLLGTSLRGQDPADAPRLRFGEGIEGSVAATRRPAVVGGAGARVAALPLAAGKELVGVLCVQSGAAASAEEDPALAEVAELLAGEIARSQERDGLRRRSARLLAIHEAGLALLATPDPEALARCLAAQAAALLEADHALVRMRDPESGRLALRAYAGAADRELLRALCDLDRQLCSESLGDGGPVRLWQLEPAQARGSGVRSALVSPLRSGRHPLGSLALYDRLTGDGLQPTDFDADDEETFGRLARLAERVLARSLAGASADDAQPDTGDAVEATREPTPAEPVPAPVESAAEGSLTDAPGLRRRLRAELARESTGDARLAVVTCRIENLRQLEEAGGAALASRLQSLLGEALAAEIGPSGLWARSGAAGFTLLLPKPSPDPDVRFSALAHGAAARLEESGPFPDALHPTLVFGYAVHPEDATQLEALLERAALPRLRLV